MSNDELMTKPELRIAIGRRFSDSCLAILTAARLLHPRPHELEQGAEHTFAPTRLTRTYWIYLAAGPNCRRLCRFCAHWFSLSERQDYFERLNFSVLCNRDGKQRARIHSAGPYVRRLGANVSLLAFVISATAAPLIFLGTGRSL
jgi:hypothetical protein